MRLLICAGGTGGGVYPALSVLAAVNPEPQAAGVEALWVGGEGGIEADLVQRANIAYTSIPAAGVHGVGLRRLPGNVVQLSRGVLRARSILRQFRPDVLFFTGGYLAVPMAVAARLPGTFPAGTSSRRLPVVLYVPDIEPGLALKTLARFADRIAVTTPDSRVYFPGKKADQVVVTGYPLRPELREWSPAPESAARRKAEAVQSLGLNPNQPVLLVTGGSSGARSINRAVLAHLPELLAEMQVVHLSGRLDWDEVQTAQKRLPPESAARYRAFPYLHEMGLALAAADLVLARAGASALGELPLFGLPALLVPYPYAWRYQRTNAEYLVKRGAAHMIIDADLPVELVPRVQSLARSPEQRQAMRQAMLSLAQPQAAEAIADLIRLLAKTGPGKGAHLG